jgi:hypothetical protein
LRPSKGIFWAVALLAAAGRPLGADLREKIVDRMDHCQASIDLVVYEIRANDIVDALVEEIGRASCRERVCAYV